MEKQANEGSMYYGCPFVVDDKHFCVWHTNLEEFNESIIRGINPEYIEYLLDVYSPGLENDETQQYASIALRAAYYQGLETFFALLFASLQAPKCVFAWLNKYTAGDLRNLVKKINDKEAIKAKPPLTEPSWESISAQIHSAMETDDEKSASIVAIFAKLWAHFASVFPLKPNIDEYNSIKHGFRLIAPGGFELTFDEQLLGESEFGSSFIQVKSIENLKHHLVARYMALNWEPEYLRIALHGIAFSIHNIRTYLKKVNGIVTDEDKYRVYTDLAPFEALLKEYTRPTVMNMAMDLNIGKDDITLVSKEEILNSYVDSAGGS